MKCKKCDCEVAFEGFCHQHWRQANPTLTCEGCYFAEFGCSEDCEETIKCSQRTTPIDCYEPRNVKPCEFRINKSDVVEMKDLILGKTRVIQKDGNRGTYMMDTNLEDADCIITWDKGYITYEVKDYLFKIKDG